MLSDAISRLDLLPQGLKGETWSTHEALITINTQVILFIIANRNMMTATQNVA